MSPAKAYLVESIPIGMEALRQTEGVAYTESVLKRLTLAAEQTIDLMAMYWNLLPDTATVDEEGFSDEQFEALGAEHGRLLYEALAAAATKGVAIRILQSPGFKDGVSESYLLAQRFPQQVQVRQIDLKAWFGDGIMHQKMWLFDHQHLYLGSANMDWKSITQVKELGVAVEYHPQIAKDAGKQFEAWWHLCELAPDSAAVLDPTIKTQRLVPMWSERIPEPIRQVSPLHTLALQTDYNADRPLNTHLNGAPGDVYISSSPPEICGSGRTDDLSALLHTIDNAQKSVCISVMNFSPSGTIFNKNEAGGASDDDKQVPTAVWWPVLIDALLRAAVTRGLHVRLLVSHWAYTSSTSAAFLKAFQQIADVVSTKADSSEGRLEVKQIMVPGWDDNNGPNRSYPGHTRVNHPKFIVTDKQVNIGTSNMTWRYFASSTGASFNSTHAELVLKLQEIFDRDWNSPYAHLLEEAIPVILADHA